MKKETVINDIYVSDVKATKEEGAPHAVYSTERQVYGFRAVVLREATASQIGGGWRVSCHQKVQLGLSIIMIVRIWLKLFTLDVR